MANSTFTPEQIQEILDIYFENFAHRQYIGARYVPIFGRKDEESIEWDNTGTYEPLTIVLYHGNSYTSRQFVPVGADITDETYWAETGNYNAQIETYRQEVAQYKQDVSNAIDEIESYITTKTFNTLDELLADENDWDYAILINGSDDKFCFNEHSITYKRVKDTDPEYAYTILYEMENGDKIIPIFDFHNVSSKPDAHFAALGSMINDVNYSYESGTSVFLRNYSGYKTGACSTLSYMFLLGLSKENSKYVNGRNGLNLIPSDAYKYPTNDESLYDNGFLTTQEELYAAIVNKHAYKINDISDIKSGDILFPIIEDDEEYANNLYNVAHCEIVMSVDYNTGYYVIWEWGGVPPTVYRSQGSNWSPCLAIKDFSATKETVKYGARFPLVSNENSTLLYEWNEPVTYSLVDVSWTSFKKVARILQTGFAPTAQGVIKVTADIAQTPELIRLVATTASGVDVSASIIGSSPYTMGGKITFYFPLKEASIIRLLAQTYNENLTFDITINSLKVEAFNFKNQADAILSAYISVNSALPNNGTDIIITPVITRIDNGMARIAVKLQNVDWTNVYVSTVIFTTTSGISNNKDYSYVHPYGYNIDCIYAGSNGWSFTSETLDSLRSSSTGAAIVYFDLPIFNGILLP